MCASRPVCIHQLLLKNDHAFTYKFANLQLTNAPPVNICFLISALLKFLLPPSYLRVSLTSACSHHYWIHLGQSVPARTWLTFTPPTLAVNHLSFLLHSAYFSVVCEGFSFVSVCQPCDDWTSCADWTLSSLLTWQQRTDWSPIVSLQS